MSSTRDADRTLARPQQSHQASLDRSSLRSPPFDPTAAGPIPWVPPRGRGALAAALATGKEMPECRCSAWRCSGDGDAGALGGLRIDANKGGPKPARHAWVEGTVSQFAGFALRLRLPSGRSVLRAAMTWTPLCSVASALLSLGCERSRWRPKLNAGTLARPGDNGGADGRIVAVLARPFQGSAPGR